MKSTICQTALHGPVILPFDYVLSTLCITAFEVCMDEDFLDCHQDPIASSKVISCGMAIYSDIGTVAGVYTSNGEVSFGSVYILVDLSVSLLDASVCVQIWRLKASKAGAKLNQIEFVRAFIAIVCCAITTVSEAIIFSMGYDRQWEVYFILTSARIVFSEIFNSSLLAGLIDQTPSRVAKLSTQKNAQAVESNSKC
ncbi:hypothetical protein BDV3_003147 [Batrachochytrium dendrobatidis]